MADGSAPIVVPGVAPAWDDYAVVVLMAGFGGSTIAIEEALGRHPEAALNHWDLGLGVHAANYPDTAHFCAGAMETDPRIVAPGRRIGLLWLSPDCRHFSPAKGSPIVSPRIRALAWVVMPWIILRRPDVIILENVEAFLTWGPVIKGPDGKDRVDPDRKGQTFERWRRRIRQAGGVMEYRVEAVADHGGHTIRKRLKVIIRFDGRPIVWPEATHAPRAKAKSLGLKPHRPAAEIIDFDRPVHSIFMDQAEARSRGLKIKRPLEEATLRRIAKGLFRYTIDNADPFIVPLTHQGGDRVRDIRDGLPTITGANRGELSLVAPHMVPITQRTWKEGTAYDVEDPLRAITTSKGGEFALVGAHVTKFRNGATGADMRDGLPTVTANSFEKRPGGAAPLGVVAAHLEEMNGRSAGVALDGAMPAGSSRAHHGMVAAFMEQANTGMVGHDMRSALSTTLSKGANQRLVAAQLSHFRTSNTAGGEGDLEEPLTVNTAQGRHHALLTAALSAEQDMAVPFSSHERELRAFLIKYYGTATAEDLADPLATGTSRSRFGLVLVAGVAYRIVDIGMRMLDPETELAAAMGVPRRYVLGWTADGRRVTKTNITKGVGNMVARQWAARIVAANCAHMARPGHVFREAA